MKTWSEYNILQIQWGTIDPNFSGHQGHIEKANQAGHFGHIAVKIK
jgi:hypothetical protein